MTSIRRSVIKIVVAVAALALASDHAPLLAVDFDWKSSNIQGPVPRMGHAMAYDSARGRVVMFGGSGNATGYLVETWEWDGNRWFRRTPLTSPPARLHPAMAYDSDRGRVVLFGGTYEGTAYDDTWEWDGNTWIEREPPTSPPPRQEHAMVYDSVRGCVVLFGGATYSSTGLLQDTWEWGGSTWTQRTPSASPRGSYGHAMAFDSARGRVVLFGGWVVKPDGSPERYHHEPDGETWEWDGTNWIQRLPGTRPSARHDHAMAFDSARGRILLVGGNPSSIGGNYDSVLDDTWEWDGSMWVERSPATRPGPRADHAMAFDSSRWRAVLFGGRTELLRFPGETWEFGLSQRVWGLRPARRAVGSNRERDGVETRGRVRGA